MKVKSGVLNKALTATALTVFLDMLGFGLLVPILPLVLIDPGNPTSILAASVSLNSRYIIIGIIVALYPLMQLIATPILGQISDRHGRRPVLIFSLIGTLFSYCLIIASVVTHSIWLLVVARIVDGLSGGNLSVAQAIVSDATDEDTRSRGFGILGAAYGVGLILGPLVGARMTMPYFINLFGLTAPYLLTCTLAAINLFFVSVYLPETFTQQIHKRKIDWYASVKHLLAATKARGVRVLFGVNFLYYASFSLITSFVSLYLVERFHFGAAEIGLFTSVIGISIAVAQIFLTRFLIEQLGSEPRALAVSLLAAATGVLLIFLPRSLHGLLLVTPLFAGFLGLSQAYILSLVSKSTTAAHQGEIFGMTSSVTALAQFAPPLVSGFAAALFAASTPLLIASGMLATAGSGYFIYLKSRGR
jgi:DHA1 family tetracycline resistance protein-like MFS transporter